MPNVVITETGLNYCTCAADGGPHIEIRYFLPLWDYRFDNNSHDGTRTSAINVSAAALSSDTTPIGEIIWNIDESSNSYTLTTADDFVLYTGTETITNSGVGQDPWYIANSVHSKIQQLNLYNGVPLSNCISGTDVYVSATTNAFTVTSGALVTGNNVAPLETSASTAKYFEVIDYYPVTSGSTVRGSIKCRLSKKIGTVRFNKIALYAVQIGEDGQPTSADPVLFAQTMIENSIVKNDYGKQGFNDVVIDVQLQLHSIAANWSDVMYGTSGDYWAITPGGLYYPERVGVGTFTDSVQEPQAKLHIKSTSNLMRLGYSDTVYVNVDTLSGGDLQIGLSAGKYMLPSINNSNYIGSSTYAWKDIRSYKFSTATNYLESGALVMGQDETVTFTDATSASKYNTVWNANLARYQEDLIIFTDQDTSTSAKDIYVVAGVENNASYYSDVFASTGQYGATHKNIIAKLNLAAYDNLNTSSKLFLVAAGGIDTYGLIKPIINENDSIGTYTYAYNYSYINSGYFKNLGTYGTANTQINLLTNLIPTTSNSYSLGSSTSIFSNIYSYDTNILSGIYLHGMPAHIGTWTSWTPTYNATVVSFPTNNCAYTLIGYTIILAVHLIYITTSSLTLQITLPTNPLTGAQFHWSDLSKEIYAPVMHVNSTYPRDVYVTISGNYLQFHSTTTAFQGTGHLDAILIYDIGA